MQVEVRGSSLSLSLPLAGWLAGLKPFTCASPPVLSLGCLLQNARVVAPIARTLQHYSLSTRHEHIAVGTRVSGDGVKSPHLRLSDK